MGPTVRHIAVLLLLLFNSDLQPEKEKLHMFAQNKDCWCIQGALRSMGWCRMIELWSGVVIPGAIFFLPFGFFFYSVTDAICNVAEYNPSLKM